MTGASVATFDLKALLRPLLEGVRLGSATTKDLTVAWVEAEEGAQVPIHQHVQAQHTVILNGRVLVTTPTGEHAVAAGQAIYIPSGTPHSAIVASNAVYVDIFYPARSDLEAVANPDAKGNEPA